MGKAFGTRKKPALLNASFPFWGLVRMLDRSLPTYWGLNGGDRLHSRMAADTALQITGVEDANACSMGELHSSKAILCRAYEPQEYPALIRVESVAKKPAFVSPATVSLQSNFYEGRVS